MPHGEGGHGDKSANSAALKDAAKGAMAAAHGADDAHGATAHHGAGGAAHGDAPHAEASAPNKYSNPLPHVLMLTAIVVGVATTAVGLALTVRIREAYGTIEEDDIQAADDAMEFGKRAFAEGPIV
ncbi:MAG: cation:proton antiporter subunit C [Pseudomonadota bacterium]